MSSSSSSLTIASSLTFNNGLTVPRLALGTWRAEAGVVEKTVVDALVAGIRHIDCAEMYGNEKEVGRGIAKALSSVSGLTRSSLFVTSKLWNTHHTADTVRATIKQTLSDLQTNYLDLLLIHWPVAWTSDSTVQSKTWSSTPLIETWRAMEEAVERGEVKSIGVSNFNEQEIEQIVSAAKIMPVTNQCETHPYLNQLPLKQFQSKHNIVHSSYSPLGNIRPENLSESPLNEPAILQIAKKYSKSSAQILLRWNLQQNNVVLFKSTNPARIQENINIFDFALTDDDMKTIEQLGSSKYRRFINPPFRQGNAQIFPK